MADLGIVLTARPSYAKLKPVIQALVDIDVHPDIYVCASALLPRFGYVYAQVRQDFPELLTIPVPSVFEGGELIDSVLSTGALTSALGREFARLAPRLVVVMADRHETLGASIAASYQNIKIAHLQGGEVSGNIDNKVRHANTMLADYHFVATDKAEERLYEMTRGESYYRDCYAPNKIWNFGCPSIDVARVAMTQPPVTDEELGGDGDPIDFTRPFLTVLYHPETECPEHAYTQMTSILRNCSAWDCVVFWPGQDAGSEGVSKAIRELKQPLGLRTVRTLPPERFLRFLCQTTGLIGNSSAGIREGSFLGTPVLDIGQRQAGREVGNNRIGVDQDNVWLGLAALEQNQTLLRQTSTLYGDGYASPKIAAKLKELL